MTSPIIGTPPPAPAAAASTPLASGHLRSEAAYFAQVLARQTNPAAALAGQAPLAGDASGLLNAASAVSAGGSTSLEMLMMLGLVAVLERLLDLQGVPEAPTAASGPAALWPVAGRLTQDFHAGHGGIDIAVPVGTPIKSTMAGEVVYAGWNDQGYGNLVIVQNGRNRTYYAHLDEILIRRGDQVGTGTVVGLSGNTGNSTGPHLHYEVRLDGIAIDPNLPPRA
jgi:murein DD-endopeptidase MepM/ murein hydrolase activator NlpD